MTLRICCVSQSVLVDDPRVRRQIQALRDAGHEVTAVALEGGGTEPMAGDSRLLPPPDRSAGGKVALALRILGPRAMRRDELATFDRLPGNAAFRAAAEAVPADLYLANDWRALPAAVAAARRHGGVYAYDSHEWAVDEFAERRSWRLVFPTMIDAIESALVPGAAFVTTVGPGIAGLLQERYALPMRPTVVRNLPAYRELPFRPAGDPIVVLYHGQFMPNRGLEQLITSVADWPERFRLVLRGYGPGDYEATLADLAATTGVASRVSFVGRAPMTELVPLANEADIGIHPLQDVSEQTRFSLPNKLFEYVMAGLAVCVADLPDMAEIVADHDLGSVMAATPAGIAAAVTSFDRERVERCKRNALEAAQTLCWEQECTRLTSLVEALDGTR